MLKESLIPLLLLLLQLSATALAESETAQKQQTLVADDAAGTEEDSFTPAQLAKGREQLGQLFDAGLDANKDGKLSKAELTAWLAKRAGEQTDKDLDETWLPFNVSEGDSLDWETYAGRRAARLAVHDPEAQTAEDTADMYAKVRQAIAEASEETGLDKAGIKVGMPEVPKPAPAPPKKSAGADAASSSDTEAEQQRQMLAMELARDRRRWEAADADSDGRLSRQEYRDFVFADSNAGGSSAKMRTALAMEALEKLDTNGDGGVSEDEFLAGAPPLPEGASVEEKAAAKKEDGKNFREVWDANKDGRLDADEMEKMMGYVESGSGSAGDAVDEEKQMHEEEADQLMKGVDADGDGSLSKAEVLASVEAFAGSAITGYGDSVGIHDEL